MFFYKYVRSNLLYTRIIIVLFNLFFRAVRASKLINKYKTGSSVIIIAVHRLGDSVFTLPAIKSIIRFHKEKIFLVCYPEQRPIYNLVLDSVNYIELNHSNFFFSNRIAKSKPRRELKKLNAKVIYDITGDATSASLIFNSNASAIIGINEFFYKTIYSKFTEVRKEPHLIDNYLDAIREIIPIYSTDYRVRLNNTKNDRILIHPFASTNSKEWGLSKYFRLAVSINNYYNCVLISQPNVISDDVKTELFKSNIKLIETNSIEELINEIKNCTLLIGNDSGAVHIANLLGKPTFTVYGPTNPDYHKPLWGENDYVSLKLPCSPEPKKKVCFTDGGVFCPDNLCMHNLNFHIVEKKLLEFLIKLKIISKTNI